MEYIIDKHANMQGTIVGNNDVIYSCTLNQTDIKTNKNKFYIMQLIETTNGCKLFIRYGRVGETGTIIIDNYSKEAGIMKFESQFKSKTGNKWNSEFVKKDGKYYLSEISYDIKKDEITKNINPIYKCNLDDRLQYFLKLISDKNMMNQMLIQFDIDTNKLPLGKISSSQLDKASDILKKINNLLSLKTNNTDEIEDLSSLYYTYVPSPVGRKKLPVIDNVEMISKYTEIIEELHNMVVAVKISDNIGIDIDPITSLYNELNTEIVPMDRESQIYKLICISIESTHGVTHYEKIKILDIFSLKRETEINNYLSFTENMDNKYFLFHGTRLSNYCSILKKGLILNPESLGVPIAGKMFGHGCYFANCVTKSLGYTSYCNSFNIGAIFICEVALGNQYKLTSSDYTLCADKMKTLNYDSTHGIGTYSPGYNIIDGIKTPIGPMTKKDKPQNLMYDEFIVYNTNQFVLRYIILFKI